MGPCRARKAVTVALSLALGSGGCTTAPAREAAFVTLPAAQEAPTALTRCGPQPSRPPAVQWLVFTSQHCTACHELLARLRAEHARLADRGIAIVEVVVDATSCPEASRVAVSRGRWPVARATETDTARWGVSSYPTTFGLRGPHLEWASIGAPAVAALLALTEEVNEDRFIDPTSSSPSTRPSGAR